MAKKHKIWIAAVLFVSVVFGVLFSTQVKATDVPSLFHNDERWYKDSTARLEMVEGIAYVPVDIFGMFSHIELSIDSRRGEFMVYNRENGRYISVLYEEKIATVDGAEEIYLNLYRLHGGYYYVPAEYFCRVMGLFMEFAPSAAVGAGVTLRISDGTETKTVEELLAAYTGTDTFDTVLPPDTSNPPVSGGVSDRTVYLTFHTVHPEYIETILAALEKASVPATFFFTKEELREYPALLAAVLSSGHSVGLTYTAFTDGASLLAEIQEANDILCGIAKMTTRLVQPPDSDALRDNERSLLEKAGYVLWDCTYDAPDNKGYTANGVKNLIANAVEKSSFHVVRMRTNATVAELIPSLLSDFARKENVYPKPIYSATQENSIKTGT